MKIQQGIFVIVVGLALACTPSQQEPAPEEAGPAVQDTETITDMDFEEGEINTGDSTAPTPAPDSGGDSQ